MRQVFQRNKSSLARLLALVSASVTTSVAGGVAAPVVRVEADETITSTRLPGNGATPLWAYGAPMIVRDGETVWASVAVTDPTAVPYCNTHWELWRRDADAGWERIRAGPTATEREPCPIALLDASTLVLSANPKVMQRNEGGDTEVTWFCQPVLPGFDVHAPRDGDAVRMLNPVFPSGATFRQHSYRGLAADPTKESLLFLMIEDDDYLPSWRARDGRWHPLPRLQFPVRAGYPQVVLRDRAAHVLAIGDILEPNVSWQEEKMRELGRARDYVFRRLFYTWTPEVAAGFQPPVEVATVEGTAGAIRNLDLLLDRKGRAHLLYSRRNIESDFMRDRFFPGEPIVDSLEHVILLNGREVARESLVSITRGPDERAVARYPFFARLHERADGGIIALISSRVAVDGLVPGELLLRPLGVEESARPAQASVMLGGHAFAGETFFTNTPRGGSRPGDVIDLVAGEVENHTMTLRYVRLTLE